MAKAFRSVTDAIGLAAGTARAKGGQTTATPKEQIERANAYRTMGRKGCRIKKLYVSLTPDNVLFLDVVAKATGRTRTTMINDILTGYRQAHPQLFEAAKALTEQLQGIDPILDSDLQA